MLGMCLDQKKGLNHAGIWISVCDFSSSFLDLLWPFERVLGRVYCMGGFHIC